MILITILRARFRLPLRILADLFGVVIGTIATRFPSAYITSADITAPTSLCWLSWAAAPWPQRMRSAYHLTNG